MPGKKKARKKVDPKPKTKSKRKSKKIEKALAKLTIKQRKLVENVMAGKSRTEAAFRAGFDVGDPNSRDDRKRAHELATRALSQPNVKQAMDLLLEQQGLGIVTILEGIKEGTKATKVVAVLNIPAQKTGEQSKSGNELIDANEHTTSYAEVPDHPTRHKFLETALSLHGLPEKERAPLDGEDYQSFIRRVWKDVQGAAIDVTAAEVKG